jgi:hypothetical protein
MCTHRGSKGVCTGRRYTNSRRARGCIQARRSPAPRSPSALRWLYSPVQPANLSLCTARGWWVLRRGAPAGGTPKAKELEGAYKPDAHLRLAVHPRSVCCIFLSNQEISARVPPEGSGGHQLAVHQKQGAYKLDAHLRLAVHPRSAGCKLLSNQQIPARVPPESGGY